MLKYIVRGMRPLNEVNKPELWGLLAHFQPCYKVPSRPKIRSMIDPEAKTMKEKIQLQLLNAEYISYTTDIWTDHTTNESFISLSAHWINGYWQRRGHVLSCRNFPESHTGVAIARILNEMLSDWGLNEVPDGVHNIIVRDGAANMRLGCNKIPMRNVHCSIHLLQLAVHDGILDRLYPKKVVSKCRALVTFLHQSARATAALRKKQVELHQIPVSRAKLLVGDVKTRWNSTYLMLLRIQTMKDTLTPFMDDEAKLPESTSAWTASKSLDFNDWAVIDSMIIILEPFFRYTEIMSMNKLTVAQVIIIMKNLELELASMNQRFVHGMKDDLLRGLRKRFFSTNSRETVGQNAAVEYNILEDPRFTVPTVLNPIFRSKDFKNKALKKKARAELTQELTELARINEEKRKREEEEILRAEDEARQRSNTASVSSTAAAVVVVWLW